MTQFSSHFPVTGSELLSCIVHASNYVLDVAITPVTHRMDSFSALYTWIELRNGTQHSFHLRIRVQRRPLEPGLDGCHRPSVHPGRTDHVVPGPIVVAPSPDLSWTSKQTDQI